jgi:hypothetical protein
MTKGLSLLAPGLISTLFLVAQPDRWQQHVNYSMKVNMDVATNRFSGTQKLVYTNNSPDTLWRVFYHLYWNAFQPNSMMDQRSRELGKTQINGHSDWDGRVRDRILHLSSGEIGYQQVKWIKMNGVLQKTQEHETILEVNLSKPILPKSAVTFDLDFEAQVPLQIRRSGRDNPQTGIRYSMSQWYPKICEYDYEGWHPTPYVAREFYGVWGDYDVSISIDKRYLLGGSGYLVNADQVGYGYEKPGTKLRLPAGDKLTWHFVAPNVHDFMWAADPEYRHLSKTAANGTTINVIYNRDISFLQKQFEALPEKTRLSYGSDVNKYIDNWDNQWNTVLEAAVTVLPFIESKFGKYPYKQYSFVHGGDGGMEYPMATLVSGPGLGTAFHEWMHSWYQMMLGTNESEYAWMDEGFTSYAEALVSEYYEAVTKNKEHAVSNGHSTRQRELIDSLSKANLSTNPHSGAYQGYFALVKSGLEEPLTTHADHFETNFAYSLASYSKGEVFMEQLGYVAGAAVRDKILLEYYRLWRFKHPNVNDFIQVAEKVSGIKLDWYREYFVNTTKTIDYGIDSLWEEGGKTKIRLINKGKMPMPIDLQLSFKDGSRELHYIPMYLMFGEKPVEDPTVPRTVYPAWKWTDPVYIVETSRKLPDISAVEIDPSQRMADINHKNNKLEIKW